MYTFAQPLSRALGTAAGSEAVVCQDHRRTYAELGSRCRRLAGAMRELGLARQDRVGVVALNSGRYLGKILKRELREPHWAGQQAHVSGG